MRVLVTGAAGFIGFHLSRKLVDLGYEVVGLDSINDYYDINLKYSRLEICGIKKEHIKEFKIIRSEKFNNYRFVKSPLENKDFYLQLAEEQKFDAIVNLAAQAGVRYSLVNPYAYIESNITGFLNVLEGARHFPVKHLVFASSSSVYGSNEKYPFSTEDNVDHPVSLYAATKKANELMAHSYANMYRIPVTGLRFFTVYGPWGRPDMALFLFTKAILAGEPINVFNYGKMKRDFTYIDDIIDGIVKVIEKPATPDSSWSGRNPMIASSSAPYRIFNIGNNHPVELLDYISAIEEALGKKGIKNMMPMQPGDVKASHADIEDLINEFGWYPTTDYRIGIRNFVDWFKEYYKID